MGVVNETNVSGVPGGPGVPRVALVQDGARLHYAVAVALKRAGLLQAMFTDWFVPKGLPGAWRRAACRVLGVMRPALAARMAARSCADLRGACILQSLTLLVQQEQARRRFASSTEYFHHCSRLNTRHVLDHRFAGANALLGFVRNLDPELVAAARRAGLATIGDQIIAPAAVEMALLHEQRQRWPDWEAGADREDLAPYVPWEQRTWESLSHITCASEFVREGLIAQGVASDRITVIPYPIAAGELANIPRRERPGPITVGFVGGVNLRKGAPMFFEIARRLASDAVRFVMVGPVRLDPGVVKSHRGRVELVGAVPRPAVASYLEQFDMLLFPSVCEGSASAVMEAMAAGLPVVTTPNAGSVVRHGVDGFLASPHDTDGLTGHVEALLRDGELRRTMGASARARAAEFSLERYSRDLAAVVRAVGATLS